jgi:anti-sigma regulatory factor (Ser/Thr protein kinase)
MGTRAEPDLAMPLVWVVLSEPASAGLVRRLLSTLFVSLPSDRLADLVLASSELVTNAIHHGDGTLAVTVWPGSSLVRVDVTDNGRAAPLPRLSPYDDDEIGWGLSIVDTLSTRWGATLNIDGPGKTTWIEMGEAPNPGSP